MQFVTGSRKVDVGCVPRLDCPIAGLGRTRNLQHFLSLLASGYERCPISAKLAFGSLNLLDDLARPDHLVPLCSVHFYNV